MKWPVAMIVLCALAGCTAYRAKPIDPARAEAEFRHRSLKDAGLSSYIRRHRLTSSTLPASAAADWDLTGLTLAAFYYHPDLMIARAQLATAVAGVQTAGALPNPTLSIEPGRESIAPPLLFSAALDLPIETAGKRRRRIEQAQALTDAARLHIEEVAWQVRAAVRSALIDYMMTRQQVEALSVEEEDRAAAVKLLDQRLAVGSLSRPELDAARIESIKASLALRTAEGHVSEALASLAAAVGLPESAFDGVEIDWPGIEQLPPLGAVSPAALQRAGLLNRSDIRKSLAEYASSEAALRLEIAKQYPDLHLSPTYAFDEGVNKYTIGISMSLPVFDQNQGPIAEAESRRKEAAARFAAVQAKAIGETELAQARYRGALKSLAEADEALLLSRQQQRSIERAFSAGQEDRLSLVGTRVEVAVAARVRVDALRSARAALGALEDAVERPLGPGSTPIKSDSDDSVRADLKGPTP